MSNATCDRCKALVNWHAGRGSRLADLRCPHCGGKLRAAKLWGPNTMGPGPDSDRPYAETGPMPHPGI
jgi:hypothetical protein